MSHWDFGRASAERQDEPIADGSGFAYDDEPGDDLTGPYPIIYERGRIEPERAPFGPADVPDDTRDPYEPYEIWPAAPMPRDLLEADRWPSEPGGRADGQSWRRPSWRVLIGAGVALAAAVTVTAVLLPGARPGRAAAGAPAATGTAATGTAAGHVAPSGAAARSGPAAPSATGTASASTAAGTGAGGAPLTLAEAQAVLAGYVAADNRANATRASQALAAIEAGSSLAIDAGQYRTALGSVPVPAPPAAYTLASATCYLPRAEPAAGPRWFVAQVGIAAVDHPKAVTAVKYLLFLQDMAGAPWRDVIEPVLLPGATAPRVAVGGDGLASAVPITAATLTAAPVRLPTLTARVLDARAAATPAQPDTRTPATALTVPANVTDRLDQRAWQAKAPALTITDRHAPAAAGQAFALRTTSGGALVFYTVAASLTITPHPKRTFRLYVPGFYAPAQALRQAVIQYRDQFAVYDPPARSGALVIIADHTGITRRR